MVVESSSWQTVFSTHRKLEQPKMDGGWRKDTVWSLGDWHCRLLAACGQAGIKVEMLKLCSQWECHNSLSLRRCPDNGNKLCALFLQRKTWWWKNQNKMLTALDLGLLLGNWSEMRKAEVKLADLRKGTCSTESIKQGGCLSIEYGSLKKCSFPGCGPAARFLNFWRATYHKIQFILSLCWWRALSKDK